MFRFIATLVLISFISMLGFTTAAQAGGDSTLSGFVYDKDTSANLANAVVKLYNISGCVATAQTDENGYYQIVAGQGDYWVEVTKPSYVTSGEEITLSPCGAERSFGIGSVGAT